MWKGHLKALGLLMGIILLIFAVVEGLGIPILTDPSPWMQHGGPLAAAVGVGLLVVDVLLPVPSSLVMVAHGSLFGVWAGTLLSLVGGLGSALTGFALGRRGGPWLNRHVSPEQQGQADRLISRWGPLAVIVTRPIPVLAESVAILAGASGMGWLPMLLSAAAGLLPTAFLYALAGSAAGSFGSTVLVFGLTLGMAGLFWWVGRTRLADRREVEPGHGK